MKQRLMKTYKEPIRILFVCHGNICRSPMAEFAMKDLARRRGVDELFEIASAATHTDEIWNGRGSPVYGPARRELARHGIGTKGNELGVSAKRARLLQREDYCRWDYLIGMDFENLYDMRDICGGDPEGKITLLLDHTDHPRAVADPWYTDDFVTAWNDVSEGCEALLEELLRR